MGKQLRTVAVVLLAAAAVVAAVNWLQASESGTSFVPSTPSELVQKAQDTLEGTGAFDGGAPAAEQADEEEPPRRPSSYRAVRQFFEDGSIVGETLESTGDDENAVAVTASGAEVVLADLRIGRKSPSSTGGPLASMYGVGSACLAAPGELYVSQCEIDTNAAGGAGVFALGRGSAAYVDGSTVSTQQSSSGGLRAVEGAAIFSWGSSVRTDGEGSPGLSIGQGGGSAVAEDGAFVTRGTSSPAVEVRGEATLIDVSLSASASPAVCVQGKNVVRLFDCRVSSAPRRDSRDDCLYNVALYQDDEADASTGRSTFAMAGGMLSTRAGGLFYVTNTQAAIVLDDVDLSQADDSPFLLRCTGNTGERGWGDTGANGATCSLTGIGQRMEGDVVWDSLSQVTVYLAEGSRFVGAVVKDDSASGNPTTAQARGQANLVVDRSSSWIVTGDSVLSSLSCEGVLADAEGNPVTVKSPEGATFVKGTSPYTVTVKDFAISADLSAAGQVGRRDDFAVALPDLLAQLRESLQLGLELGSELQEGEEGAAEAALEAIAEEAGEAEEPAAFE